MTRRITWSFAALLLGTTLLPQWAAAQTATQTSLRDTVPSEAHMAIVWRRNPEQDYQRKYLGEVISTFKQERIAERIFAMIEDRVDADDMDKAQEGMKKLQEAVAPASLDALFDAEELAYSQVMEGQMANHLFVIRMTPQAAQGYMQATTNLLEMAEEEAKQELDFTEERIDGARYLTIDPPVPAPIQPTIVAKDDVLIISTTQPLARAAVMALKAESPKSKFDDPRVTAALAKLPEAEDTIVLFDGRQQMDSLKAQLAPVLENIRDQEAGNPQAGVAARLIEAGLAEVNVMDLEVTVGYTKDGHNQTETLGMLRPGSEQRILRKIIEGGASFEQWNRWVPANAVNYRLNTGFNPLQVYRDVLDLFSREAPEMAAEALIKLEELQQQAGVNLEDDLLGLFSGETVSVTLPGGQSVTALACPRPERTQELLHRVVDLANQLPQVQQQQLELVESENLEGFEDLRANLFAMLAARPVIGFKDGWMILGSTPEAAQAVLDVRWGDAADVTTSEDFKRFGLSVDGPVNAISYSNTSANIRQAAQFINQAAAMAPLFVGPMMAEAKPEDAKTVQQALGLLPSIARVIEKFDFLEATLSVGEPDEQHGAYRKHTVVLIRQD